LPAPYKATRRVAGAGNVGEGGVEASVATDLADRTLAAVRRRTVTILLGAGLACFQYLYLFFIPFLFCFLYTLYFYLNNYLVFTFFYLINIFYNGLLKQYSYNYF